MQNEIQVGRYNGILHKLLDMKEGAPAPTLATDVFPTLVLEQARPEWQFLAGVRQCQGVTVQNATAGENSHVVLRNPAGSNTLITVDRIWPLVTAAAFVYVYLVLTDYSTGITDDSTMSITDSRWNSHKPTARLGHGSAVGSPIVSPFSFKAYGFANATVYVPGPWVLAPNSCLLVYDVTTNQALNVSWWWTERVLEASETR